MVRRRQRFFVKESNLQPFVSRKESPINRLGDFRSFEQVGWENAAHRYHDAFGELTGQSIGPLLNAVGVGGGVIELPMPAVLASAAKP